MSTRTVTKAEVSQLSTMVFRAILTEGTATVRVANRSVDRDAHDTRTIDIVAATMVNRIASHTGWTKDEVRAEYDVACRHESKARCRCVARGTLRSEFHAIVRGERKA